MREYIPSDIQPVPLTTPLSMSKRVKRAEARLGPAKAREAAIAREEQRQLAISSQDVSRARGTAAVTVR